MSSISRGISIFDCCYCVHIRENIGFQMACDAFPDGIPYDFDYDHVKTMKECNNGLGFEEDEEKSKIFTGGAGR